MNRNPVSCSDKDLVFAIGDLRFPCGEEAADWRRIVKDCPHLVHACGTNCAKCPSNRVRCQGCPTSWFYVADFAPEAEGRAPSGCPGPARGAKTF